MKMAERKQKIKRTLFVVAMIAVLFVGIIFCGGFSAFNVYAAESVVYSNVLSDLQKDSDFDLSDYPTDNADYNLYIDQIAESTDGELFLYVYQPYAGIDYDLSAVSVNISTGINDNLYYNNYKLTLLNSEGVFHKYRVDGFELKKDALRYYDISAIYRAWYGDIDQGVSEGNSGTVSLYAISIAQLWTACTVNGEVSYTRTNTTVVEIKPQQKYVGYLRYLDGIGYIDRYNCDRWYVAFSSDFAIDDLYEADVSFSSRTYLQKYTWWGLVEETTYGEWQSDTVTLSQDRIIENELTGIWGQQHEWKEIESVSDFIASNDLTDEGKAALQEKQWVISFAVTDYTVTGFTEGVWYERNGTEIADIAILRLKFETDGKVYNLGVVDSMQTPDPDAPPDNNPDVPDLGNLGDWDGMIKLIFGVIIFILLLPFIIWFLPYLIKLVIWVVMLPFKLIGAIFKGISKTANKQKRK